MAKSLTPTLSKGEGVFTCVLVLFCDKSLMTQNVSLNPLQRSAKGEGEPNYDINLGGTACCEDFTDNVGTTSNSSFFKCLF